MTWKWKLVLRERSKQFQLWRTGRRVFSSVIETAQNITTECLEIANTIGEYAATEYFDLRNEDSVNFCKKVKVFMEEKNVGYFFTV